VDDRRKTLEALVADRTATLQSALARLEETQDELVRRERLATLGELAGGVGHELRNPLGVMTNALYYLDAINSDAPYKVQEYMGILKSQVAISEKIVSDLLDFGRLETPDRSEVEVEALVRRGLERRPVAAGISVEVDIPSDLPPVFVDPGHMDQVMVNLISNAVDAMEGDHGTLSFTAASDDGEHVTLRVSDTGRGIAADRLQSIFEPLVTTKAKGIGLGLAVSRLLASANDVVLSAESEVGEGSTFKLTFPVFHRKSP
jgi:signal transduction histidine kinase